MSQHDDKGNYIGPRGKRLIEVFICHGCQSCWEMQEDGTVIDTGPHYLSVPKDVTDLYTEKKNAIN